MQYENLQNEYAKKKTVKKMTKVFRKKLTKK